MMPLLRSAEHANSGRPLTPAPISVASCAWAAPASRRAMPKENLIGTTPAIDAPRPAPGRGEVKEHEAVERGELAAVDERPETLRRMRHEISEGHFTGENERHRPREDSE